MLIDSRRHWCSACKCFLSIQFNCVELNNIANKQYKTVSSAMTRESHYPYLLALRAHHLNRSWGSRFEAIYSVIKSTMKILGTLALLFRIIRSLILNDSSKLCCRSCLNRFRGNDVCVKPSIWSGNRPDPVHSSVCFGDTQYCVGHSDHYSRGRRQFVTFPRQCRPGNDQGRVCAYASIFVCFCRNAHLRLWVCFVHGYVLESTKSFNCLDSELVLKANEI